MTSNATSENREIKRIPIACTICRQRKLKCRPSGIDERCQRCVENGGVCQFVPVTPTPPSINNHYTQSPGYPNSIAGNACTADYYANFQSGVHGLSTTQQQNNYWSSMNTSGMNSAAPPQQIAYGHLGADSTYSSQELYPQGLAVQYTYPDTSTPPSQHTQYNQVSRNANNTNFVDTTRAEGYYNSAAYMAQYGQPLQQTYPTDWATSTTFTNGYGTTAGSVNDYYYNHHNTHNTSCDNSSTEPANGV